MKIKNYFLNNLGLKITALFLAFISWIIIVGRERAYTEEVLNMPIEIINVKKNMDLRVGPNNTITVKVKGTINDIKALREKNLSLKLDASKMEINGNLTVFTQDHLKLPPKINVLSVMPKWLRINSEKFIYKEVPVNLSYKSKGDLPQNITLLSKDYRPHKVKLFGLESQLEKINSIKGKIEVNLSEIFKDTEFEVPFDKPVEVIRIKGYKNIKLSIKVKENENEEK